MDTETAYFTPIHCSMPEFMIEPKPSYIVFMFVDNCFDNESQFVENYFDFQNGMKHNDTADECMNFEQNIEQDLNLLSKTLNNKALDYSAMNNLLS